MKKLGKGLSELGLSELLGGSTAVVAQAAPSPSEALAYDKISYLTVNQLFPGEYQPRRHIEQSSLVELADSIRSQGILQPLIVRAKANQGYEIIAGERRWRAAQLAGLAQVPAIIRDIPDQTAIAFGLIENIQRRDLNALEEALALHRLLQEFNLTHEAVAQAVGKSRTTITNLLRLLQLNAEVKAYLMEGRLEMGHARALLALEGLQQSLCAERVIAEGLSVRQTEALVQTWDRTSQLGNQASREADRQPAGYALESQRQVAEKLGAKVMIRYNAHGKGKLVIHYHNLDELAGILTHIK